jgi:ATP-dependent helicase HrpB
MIALPIDESLPAIASALKSARSLVIVAEPGAGKTTRVPPALLRGGLLGKEHPNLVMLQPRRVAARAAAQRIADENHWTLGDEVGYHVRFDKRLRAHTPLRVLTEGILTRQMLDDPFLDRVGGVILDEFHERSIHVDLAVAMLREMQQTVRPDLLIVIMSATLAAEAASEYLGNCPIIRVPGRAFPVEVEYEPHATAPVVGRVVAAVQRELTESQGDILVFLPGAEEIRRAMHQLESAAERSGAILLPLHGSLPTEEQTLPLRPAKQRKIILATNIAETSLTIDGVKIVIDSGLARVPAFDARRGLDRLELTRISKASATQRSGRAGRTGPGRCIRLWSAKEHAALDDFESPEISRVDLSALVLDLHAWGKPHPFQFGWFEAPPAAAVESAQRLLQMLGAVEGAELTALGKKLMRLPAHPRIGRLLLAAAEAGCPDEGATLAALLSERDIRRPGDQHFGDRRPATLGPSDVLLRIDDLAEAERDRFGAHLRDRRIDPIMARQVAKSRDEFRRLARRLCDRKPSAPSQETLLRLLLLPYPDRVCRRREGDRAAAAMVGGGGVRLAPESVVRQAEFFLALDARHDPRSASREAVVQLASEIDVRWLHEVFPHSIRKEREYVFDAERQRVVALGKMQYQDLVLALDSDAPVDATQAGKVLGEALRPRAIEIFHQDKPSASILARMALLRKHMPEHPWPLFDEAELGDILLERCDRKRSVEELMRSGLADGLRARLHYPVDRLLNEYAPETLSVPTGNNISLDYSMNQAPILAVRLQEIFGWTQTPRIAGGRVPVLLHLLGPNFRPVQITDDLQSFWSGTYFQVRKDLKVRYPRHSWPDDPLSATPQAKGKRRSP